MSDSRCPRCGAARRPGDQWCGLCYADFREPPPAVVGDATPPPAPAEAVPGTPAASGLAPPLIRPPGQPEAAPIPAQSVPSLPAQSTGGPFIPSTNPLAPTATVPTQLPPGVTPSAPADPAAAAAAGAAGAAGAAATTSPAEGAQQDAPDPAADLKWPCPKCSALVPMAEDYCPACGTGFLADAATSGGVKIPLIGDVGKMNSGQKLVFGSAIALGIILGIIVLLTIGGKVF